MTSSSSNLPPLAAEGKTPAANPVQARVGRYLFTTRITPGVAPMSTDVLQQTLQSLPDVKIVKELVPRGLAMLSLAPETMPVKTLVAEMPAERFESLRRSAPANVIAEPDYPLIRFTPAAPALPALDPNLLDKMTLATVTPATEPFQVVVQVQDSANKPLANAAVYVYGTGYPGQGTTDASGRATVQVVGGTIDTVAAIYVKPAADCWELFVTQPQLQAGVANVLTLTRLSDWFTGFPGKQITGWGQSAMNLDKLPAQFTGKGVKIGLIDSGCDTTHPDLGAVANGLDIIANDPNSWKNDTEGHGTHCAGIICGNASNNYGIRGFAPDAVLYVYKVFPRGAVSDVIAALHECEAAQVDVVNLSLGSPQVSDALEQELGRAKAMGIACIVAAGNSGDDVQYPASSPNVCAVAAIGKTNEFPSTTFHARQELEGAPVTSDGYFAASFSCHGPEVKVCAPGVGIVSSVPGGFAAWDGTSMATPHVTGLAALVLAHHPAFQGAARDGNRVDELFRIIGASADPIDLGDPTRTGAGLPDAQRALAVSATSPPVTSVGELLQWVVANFQPAAAARSGASGPALATMASAPPNAAAPAFRTDQAARDYLIGDMKRHMRAASLT